MDLSSRATSELERLGVQLWTNNTVTHINADGVFVGQEHLASDSVLWAAGVQACRRRRSERTLALHEIVRAGC
jgi:NADH:ubiquinone reductase (H+-translocating)